MAATVRHPCGHAGREDLFADTERDPPAHIHPAQLADPVLVAPATFDFIGKVAAGWADDPVSLVMTATTVHVLLTPAVRDTM